MGFEYTVGGKTVSWGEKGDERYTRIQDRQVSYIEISGLPSDETESKRVIWFFDEQNK